MYNITKHSFTSKMLNSTKWCSWWALSTCFLADQLYVTIGLFSHFYVDDNSNNNYYINNIRASFVILINTDTTIEHETRVPWKLCICIRETQNNEHFKINHFGEEKINETKILINRKKNIHNTKKKIIINK